jgi:surface antigen Omp85-like protein
VKPARSPQRPSAGAFPTIVEFRAATAAAGRRSAEAPRFQVGDFMRVVRLSRLLVLVVLAANASVASAQQAEPTTRQGAIEQQEAAKVKDLRPYTPSKGERISLKIQDAIAGETKRFHPFFESAYPGGGFALGAGYTKYVSSYSFVDVRGSYSLSNYKRLEAEFVAPHLFHRRGKLSVLGGWRDAPEVDWAGTGNDTSKDDFTSYRLKRPYGLALLTLKPTRRYLTLRGGLELTKVTQETGEGRYPSVETVYTAATLPGLFGEPTYVHSQATFGFDFRPEEGYARRGGFIGITGHDYNDRDNQFGFHQLDYEGILHIPVLREAWVFSFRARAQTTGDKSGEVLPFFMYPFLGGSSTLRGYSSLRFRDRNSILFQGEWRIMANRYLDSAIFYDAGKVTARRGDLDFDGLKHDYGFGVRFHGPTATPLRIELARGSEGLVLVFASSAAF